jgi:hypothetical protein
VANWLSSRKGLKSIALTGPLCLWGLLIKQLLSLANNFAAEYIFMVPSSQPPTIMPAGLFP